MRPRLLLLSAVLLGIIVALSWAWPVYRNHRERAEALNRFRAGRFAEAKPLLRRTLQRQPHDFDSLRALVEVCQAGGEPLAAEPLLKQWCDLRPHDAEPWKRLRKIYRQHNKPEDALKCARAVVEREADNRTARRHLAELLVSCGQLAEAERVCRTCLDELPKQRGLLLLMAEIKRGQGRNEESENILRRLQTAHPDYVAAQIALGTLYRETGRFDEAIPLLKQVLHRDPRRARVACYQLTMALQQAGRHEEAQRTAVELRYLQDAQILRELLPSQPDNLELKIRLAEMLLEHGEIAEGSHLLDEVLRREPAHPSARRLRARYTKN